MAPSKRPYDSTSPQGRPPSKKGRTDRSSSGQTNGDETSAFFTPGAPRPLVIREFTGVPSIPANFVNDELEKVRRGVNDIFRTSKCRFEEVYQAVVKLCTLHKKDVLYDALRTELDTHIEASMLLITMSHISDHLEFLKYVEKLWSGYCNHMKIIGRVAIYLDRNYDKPTTWKLGLRIFRSHQSLIERDAITCLLKAFNDDRNRSARITDIVRNRLSVIVKMFDNPPINEEETLEEQFINSTSDFYAEEGERLFSAYGVIQYLEHVQSRLVEEEDRVLFHGFQKRTLDFTIMALREQLISRFSHKILEQFEFLVQTNSKANLRLLYSLYKGSEELKLLEKEFYNYVFVIGSAIMATETSDVEELISDLLDLYSYVFSICEESFSKDPVLLNSVDDAFSEFLKINHPHFREKEVAEVLAGKFHDALLIAPDTLERETVKTIDNLAFLFKFITGKYFFQKSFLDSLPERVMLNGKEHPVELEEYVLSKIEPWCRVDYVHDVQEMIHDIKTAITTCESFKTSEQAASNILPGLEANFIVLKQSIWPPYKSKDFRLPQELTASQNSFNGYFEAHNETKKIDWMHSMGDCVLRANFPDGQIEISATNLQATVLMLFNNVESLSYEEIRARSGIPEPQDLQKCLLSLTNGDFKILRKEPSTGFKTTDNFVFNKEFHANTSKIKLGRDIFVQDHIARKIANAFSSKAFTYRLDAKIVRTMKKKRELTHARLLHKVNKEFKLEFKMGIPEDEIMPRIKSLISRDYLLAHCINGEDNNEINEDNLVEENLENVKYIYVP